METQKGENQGGLTGAVWAQQSDCLTGPRDAKTAGNPLKDFPLSQPDSQILEFDDRCCVQLPALSCFNSAR